MIRGGGSTLGSLIEKLWEAGGTDLLLTPGVPPLARVGPQLRPVADEPALRPQDTERLVMSALTESQAAELASRLEIDFSFNWEDRARFRGNAYHQRDSLALTLRATPIDIPSPEQLGLPAAVSSMAARRSGLVLVSGPAASGRSTTLAALVDVVNRNRGCHILTIEDPIEYVFHHRRATVNQREVGSDTESFARALRSARRERPDVLMCGDLPDPESIEIVLTMADTGHLVLASLHSDDTAHSIDRVVGAFPAERRDQVRLQLASSLAAAVHQRLVPRVAGGLVAAFEVLVGTPAVRSLIRHGNTRRLREAVTAGRPDGMQTLEGSLGALVAAGVVDHADAAARSLHPGEIRPATGIGAPPAGEPAGSRPAIVGA